MLVSGLEASEAHRAHDAGDIVMEWQSLDTAPLRLGLRISMPMAEPSGAWFVPRASSRRSTRDHSWSLTAMSRSACPDPRCIAGIQRKGRPRAVTAIHRCVVSVSRPPACASCSAPAMYRGNATRHGAPVKDPRYLDCLQLHN